MRKNLDRSLFLLWHREEKKPKPRSTKRGATRLGLTRKTIASWRRCKITDVDLSELQRGTAGAILDVWFWRAVRADELPVGIDYLMFCHAVAVGTREAVNALQFALSVPLTGTMDSKTLRAVEAERDLDALIQRVTNIRRRTADASLKADLAQIEAQALSMAGSSTLAAA
jgi:lysozyme family protein